MWRDSGSHIPHARMLEDKPSTPTDRIRWIDTARMIADCLTKMMKEDELLEVLKTNKWDYEQSAEMKAGKTHKQNLRSASKKDKKDKEEQKEAQKALDDDELLE